MEVWNLDFEERRQNEEECNDPNFQINLSFLINQNILIKDEISMTIVFKIHNINILFQISECPIKSNVEECMPRHQALPLFLGSDVPETNQQTVS